MYTQEVLRRVEAKAGKTRQVAERKLRRIRQELHEVAYKKHGTKLEPLILVKVKCYPRRCECPTLDFGSARI